VSTDERTEWLAWRKLGIGASDIAALIGMSKYASPMSIWTDKLGLSPMDEDNDYLEYGRRAEPMLVGYFEDRNPGLFVVDCQARIVHPEVPWHRATLDGYVVEHPDGGPLGVVEFKTTGFDVWDEIPDAYACQVQWQMHCTGTSHAWFGVLHNRKFCTYEVERDDRAIATLTEVADRFWNDHVLAEKPPPADAHKATADALAAAYPDPVEGAAAPLDDVADALAERARIKAVQSDAKVDLARAENAIKAALGNAEVGTIGGEPVLTWKKQHRDGYTVKPTTYRALNLIGGKS
jgi:putative phage-type endonuclease